MEKRKIWFKTSEKLALLRIMIDIYNYYPRRFDDKAINVIINTAKKTFKLPNGYKEASTMSISEAKSKIKYYSHDRWKEKFLGDFLSVLLCASNTKDASKLKWDYISDLSKELRFTIYTHFGKWGLSDWIIVDTHNEMLWANKRRDEFETNLISCPKTNKVVKQSLLEVESEDFTLLPPDVNIAHQEIMNGNNHNSIHACDNLYKKLNEELRTELIADIHRDLKEELRLELKEEVRKDLIATINRDLKEALYNELKDILSKDIKDILRKEIRNELHSGMKSFVNDNFNETLYKDL